MQTRAGHPTWSVFDRGHRKPAHHLVLDLQIVDSRYDFIPNQRLVSDRKILMTSALEQRSVAAIDNRPMAQSVGVNTSAAFTLTFAAGCGLAALGGALGAGILAIDPHYPFEHLVKFLIVIWVGGLGTRGPFIAGQRSGDHFIIALPRMAASHKQVGRGAQFTNF